MRMEENENTRRLGVKELRCHQEFNETTLTADICLVVLYQDINLDNRVSAIIKLPDSPPKTGMVCTSLGWGRLYEVKYLCLHPSNHSFYALCLL